MSVVWNLFGGRIAAVCGKNELSFLSSINVWCHLILTFSGIIITSSSGVDPDALSSAFGRHLDDDVRVCVR